MPLNGGGTASRVPGTTAVPNQTIKSADYNSEMDDVYNILNTARPIAYGGTGATNAADARTNLGIPESISSGEAFRGYLYNLTLSNNVTDATNDIDITSGSAASDGTVPVVMPLAAALTKRLDAAWAVGSGNGGLDTGSIANTTYHVWLIQRSDTGVVDALFSTSATSPTMPANYDRKRRIGAILRESGAIVLFLQFGDTFIRRKVQDVSVASFYASTGTTLSVPALIKVQPIMEVVARGGTTSDVAITMASADDVTSEVVSVARSLSSGVQTSWVNGGFWTNTSRQIYTAVAGSGTVVAATVNTKGWIDSRGRT